MPTNKELEKRMKELDRRIRLLEAQEKLMETGNQELVAAVSQSYISFEWNPALKLWRARLENVDDFLKEVLGPGALSVMHDHPKQAFEMLLQKLQQRVS